MIRWVVSKKTWAGEVLSKDNFDLYLRRRTDAIYMDETERSSPGTGGIDGRWSGEMYCCCGTFDMYLWVLEHGTKDGIL